MKAVSALIAQQSTGSIPYPIARAGKRRARAASNQARFEVERSAPRDSATASFSVVSPGFIAALVMLLVLAGVAGWMLRQLFNLWFG